MRGKKQKEPVGMNPSEIFAALAMLEKERGIPQTFMMEKIIQAITTAYKRDHDGVENVIVDVDEEHQTLTMFVQKNVVDEEDYVDPDNEMTLAEAKAISAKYEIGDIVNIPVDNTEFGRIAAGNGKQVRDILHAEDMISLYYTALNNVDKVCGQAYNIGGTMEQSLSLLELFAMLEDILGIRMEYVQLPPRQSDQKVFVADIEKIHSRIGWMPQVSAREGVEAMVQWVKGMGK